MRHFRLSRAGWIMVREGVVAALPGDQLSGLPKFGWRDRQAVSPSGVPRGAAAATGWPRAVARLGPSYVKLGQFLATRPDVVGNDIALDLAVLQDRMETFPTARFRRRHRGVARPAGRRSLRQSRRTDRGRLDRAGPSGRSATATARPARSPSRSSGRRAQALPAAISRAISSPPACRSATSRPRGGCGRSR